MYYSDPYHGDWTASRIGTPEQKPQVYANASPLSHIDRLERFVDEPTGLENGTLTVRRACSTSKGRSSRSICESGEAFAYTCRFLLRCSDAARGPISVIGIGVVHHVVPTPATSTPARNNFG